MDRLDLTTENAEEESSSVVFRDVITLTLLGIVFVLLMIIPFINPPKKKDNSEIAIPGEMVVEMIWDPKYDIDMDLWVKAPDEVPVGYSNRKSLTVNLLRDDLGHRVDISNLNYEHAFVRSLKEGEYIINAHAFRWGENINSLKVKFIVTVRSDDSAYKRVLTRTVEFTKQGEERTIMRFEVDNNGKIIDDSINYEFISLLRSRKKVQ